MRAVRFGSYSIADDLRRHARLVPLEVDLAIALLVTRRAEARGDATVVVAADLLHLVLEEALLGLALRDLAEVLRGHATAARRGWLVKTNRHGLDALEELDVVAGLQRDERLLPRRTLTGEPTNALHLAAHDERADFGDGDLEQLLDRAADLDLVRVASDLEHDLLRVRLALGGATCAPPVSRRRALFSVRSGRLMTVCALRIGLLLPLSASVTCFAAACVRTSVSWRRMS